MANNKMYNNDQKQEYIDYEGINSTALRQYFIRLYDYEEIYNKDIADMNIEELKTSLTSLSIRSIKSRRHCISLVKGYINWAIYNGKTTNSNKIDGIRADDINSNYAIKTQMLKSLEQVNIILATVYDNKGFLEQSNRTVYEKLMFLLLYSGLNINELQILRKTDIEYNKKVVYSPIYEEKEYEVDDQIVMLWNKCIDITFLERVFTDGDDIQIKKTSLVDNEYLFRSVNNKNNDGKMKHFTMFYAISKIFKTYFAETNIYIKVSPNAITLSGVFYKLMLLEKNGEVLTPEIFSEYLNINYNKRSELMDKTRRSRFDYSNWKSCFGYDD